MPRTAHKSKPTLGIKLEGNRSAYYPGDTIIGCVYRTSSLSCSEPYVYISLHGRTKAKYWVDHGGDGSVPLRSSLVLLSGQRHRQKLQDVMEGSKDGNPRFTGVTEKGGHGAFVEYYLLADLPVQGRALASHEATMPIKILSSVEQSTITDHLLQERQHQLLVNSVRLVPGMENHRPSFSERLKKTFAPKIEAKLSFQLDIQVPRVMQLGSEMPLPFLVSATPLWGKTDEIIRNVPQKIFIVGLSVILHSITEVKCERDQLGEWENSLPLAHRLPLSPPIEIQCTGEGEQPVDIGTEVKLQIPKKKPYEVTLFEIEPDYVAWNFRHSHRIEYELKCMVGGKTAVATGEQAFTIMPPSNVRDLGDLHFVVPPPYSEA